MRELAVRESGRELPSLLSPPRTEFRVEMIARAGEESSLPELRFGTRAHRGTDNWIGLTKRSATLRGHRYLKGFTRRLFTQRRRKMLHLTLTCLTLTKAEGEGFARVSATSLSPVGSRASGMTSRTKGRPRTLLVPTLHLARARARRRLSRCTNC